MRTLFFALCLPFMGYSQTLWTLDDCISYAKEHNLSIKQSEIDLKSTDIDRLQAKGAFLPSINGNLSYNFNSGKNINPVTNQYENTVFQSASGGIGAEMTLFAGLQNWRKLQRATLNQMASEYQLEKVKEEFNELLNEVEVKSLTYSFIKNIDNFKAEALDLITATVNLLLLTGLTDEDFDKHIEKLNDYKNGKYKKEKIKE